LIQDRIPSHFHRIAMAFSGPADVDNRTFGFALSDATVSVAYFTNARVEQPVSTPRL
jgi:hypothetical protein